jgi:hypothetical protein
MARGGSDVGEHSPVVCRVCTPLTQLRWKSSSKEKGTSTWGDIQLNHGRHG